VTETVLERERDRERKRERDRERKRERERGERERETQSLNHLSVHQLVRSPSMHQNNSHPIGFLSLKLPPVPCAVLLVLIKQEYVETKQYR
jgi:hypothetical protein